MSNAWYDVISAVTPLTQGDLIPDCPILSWKKSPEVLLSQLGTQELLNQLISPISMDVVVISQACDLAHSKIANVVLCPHIALDRYREIWSDQMSASGQKPTEKAWRRVCDDITNGYVWNHAFLNSHSGVPTNDIRIVDFHELYTLPRSFLESIISQRKQDRLRLLPPYREHLSQAFARFFMRVGLPTPIDKTW